MRPSEQRRREEQRLASMARNATDLGGGPIPPEVAAKALVQAETQLGMRCAGCGERITIGFVFTKIEAVVADGRPTVDVMKVNACNGSNECDFAMRAKEDALVMEAIEFAWLDAPADDAPAPAAAEARARAEG